MAHFLGYDGGHLHSDLQDGACAARVGWRAAHTTHAARGTRALCAGDDYLRGWDIEQLLNGPFALPSACACQQKCTCPPSSSLASAFDLPGPAPATVRRLRSFPASVPVLTSRVQAMWPVGSALYATGVAQKQAGAGTVGGPDTPPQQLQQLAHPAQQFGAWPPDALAGLLCEPQQHMLPLYSAAAAAAPPQPPAARQARGRVHKPPKVPKPPKEKGVLLAMARFARRQAPAAVVEPASSSANAAELLTSLPPPVGDAAGCIVSTAADATELQPAALLAAVDLSAPPVEGAAAHDEELFTMFLSESIMQGAS